MGSSWFEDTKKHGRLKVPKADHLQEIGLPSKGDRRLLSPQAQDTYYHEILRRCIQLPSKAPANPTTDLTGAFQNLTMTEVDNNNQREIDALSAIARLQSLESSELSIITQAMRKLREAIVATRRIDDRSSSEAYVFMIRASILLRNHEAYHPALLYLLHKAQASSIPSIQNRVLRQLMEYQVLDLACRQGDLQMAYQISLRHGLRGSKTFSLLKALARGNWVLYKTTIRALDQFQRSVALTDPDSMLQHALSCIGRSYLQIEEHYLQRWFQKSTDELRKENKVDWSSNAGMTLIRQIKRK